MNTAPNRRASDNASSPPGTSPTRRFSDMLKESSGSDGVNVLTLYSEFLSHDEDTGTLIYKAYKNAERTIEFSGYQEAVQALESADIIKVLQFEDDRYLLPLFATLTQAVYIGPMNYNVAVTVIIPNGFISVILAAEETINQY